MHLRHSVLPQYLAKRKREEFVMLRCPARKSLGSYNLTT